jgi:hypothetical protein
MEFRYWFGDDAACRVGRDRAEIDGLLHQPQEQQAARLGPAITAAIEVGSRVRTDDWRGYGGQTSWVSPP